MHGGRGMLGREIRERIKGSKGTYKMQIENRPIGYSVVLTRPDGQGRTINYVVLETIKEARNYMNRKAKEYRKRGFKIKVLKSVKR